MNLLIDRFSEASVHVALPTTIFVIIEKREAFELIALPLTDHGLKPNGGHVLTKSIDADAHVIFQFWIKKPLP